MTKNPAFYPLVEKMFGYLDKKNLDNCRLVSKSWKTVLDRPLFWLKKIEDKYGKDKELAYLFRVGEVTKCWKKLIEKQIDPDIRSLITLSLINIYRTEEQNCICAESDDICESSGFIHPKGKKHALKK